MLVRPLGTVPVAFPVHIPFIPVKASIEMCLNDQLHCRFFYGTLFIPALISAIAVDHKPSSSSFVTAKRGIVEAGHAAPQDYKFRQSKPSNSNARSNHSNNSKSLAYYKNVKAASPEASHVGSSGYEDVFKQPYASLSSSGRSEAQTNEQSSPYYGNLFTMSAGYKVASEDKPLKQIGLHSYQSNDGYSSNQGARNQNAARGEVFKCFKAFQPYFN